MEKNTLSTWGWVIVTTIIIALLIVMMVPFADTVTAGIKNTVNQVLGHNHECIPGPESTCTTAQRCTECNKLINPPSAHLSDTSWDSSDINHWNNCVYGCGTKLNLDVHTPSQDVNYAFCDEEVYCTICSFVIKEATEHNKVPATNETPEHCTDCDWVNSASLCQHTTFTWQHDTSNHWKLCSDCGTSFDNAIHIPLTDATCEGAAYCFECGVKIVPALGHESVYGGLTDCHEKCSRCGITLSSSHTFTTVIYREATCSRAGSGRKDCACGYSYAISPERLPHSYSYNTTIAYDENGNVIVGDSKVIVTCVNCGYKPKVTLSGNANAIDVYVDGKYDGSIAIR